MEQPNLMELPAGDSTWPWIGTRVGSEYYARVCGFWRAYRKEVLIFYRTEKEARAYGLTRSTRDGC